MEERHRRAEGWMHRARLQITSIEPEWWLRMECGQLAEEAPSNPYTAWKRVMQRAQTKFRHFAQRRLRPD